MPQDPSALADRNIDERVLARLVGAPAHWVDGGPISGWKPVHSRFAKPVGMPGKRAKFVFTRIATPWTDPVVEGWLAHQRALVVPRKRRGEGLVFWRLAVRQRAFAIDAYPRADAATAIERARWLVERYDALRVVLAFLPGELVPAWAVHDGRKPVFIGLPDHHLVPTVDVGESLAAILAGAQVRAQVRDVIGSPLAEAR